MTQPPHGRVPPRGTVQPPPVPDAQPDLPWLGRPHTVAAPKRRSPVAVIGVCLGAVAVLVLGLVAIVALNRTGTPLADPNLRDTPSAAQDAPAPLSSSPPIRRASSASRPLTTGPTTPGTRLIHHGRLWMRQLTPASAAIAR